MDGLPPLPKSLSGLLNFSRESLSRAEATLGLRNPGPPTPQANPQKPNPVVPPAQHLHHQRQKTPTPNFAPPPPTATPRYVVNVVTVLDLYLDSVLY